MAGRPLCLIRVAWLCSAWISCRNAARWGIQCLSSSDPGVFAAPVLFLLVWPRGFGLVADRVGETLVSSFDFHACKLDNAPQNYVTGREKRNTTLRNGARSLAS